MQTAQLFSLFIVPLLIFLKTSEKLFSDFSRLKPNTTKYGIAGIGVLTEVRAAVCGMR